MIAVTGATGHLGRLAIETILDRGVPAGELVAAVRTPAKAADLAARGVQIRRADLAIPRRSAPRSRAWSGCSWSRGARWGSGSSSMATRSGRRERRG